VTNRIFDQEFSLEVFVRLDAVVPVSVPQHSSKDGFIGLTQREATVEDIDFRVVGEELDLALKTMGMTEVISVKASKEGYRSAIFQRSIEGPDETQTPLLNDLHSRLSSGPGLGNFSRVVFRIVIDDGCGPPRLSLGLKRLKSVVQPGANVTNGDCEVG
jgi:hypothetical protein